MELTPASALTLETIRALLEKQPGGRFCLTFMRNGRQQCRIIQNPTVWGPDDNKQVRDAKGESVIALSDQWVYLTEITGFYPYLHASAEQPELVPPSRP